MNRRSVAMLVVSVLAGVFPATAQQPPSADQIARFRAAAEPGPEHEMLGQLAGEWDLVLRAWPEPGADPFEGTGRATNRMLLEGRFLESAASADFMGEPTGFVSLFGFDRRSGLFTVVQLDTEGTYWVTGAGPAEPDGRIVMSGRDEDPLLGHTQIYDFVLRVESADRYLVEVMFRDEMHTRGGAPFRAVQLVATRRVS